MPLAVPELPGSRLSRALHVHHGGRRLQGTILCPHHILILLAERRGRDQPFRRGGSLVVAGFPSGNYP